MSLSLTKALRTDKVAVDPTKFLAGTRLFDANIALTIPEYFIDSYGRPVNAGSSLPYLGPGNAPGAYSAEYMIQLQNNVMNPNYSLYLDVPQGVMKGGLSEYSKPAYDTMLGTNNPGRDKLGVFNIDGEYRGLSYPEQATNPNSDTDFAKQQQWMAQQSQTQFRNRVYLNSAAANSGF